MKTKTLIALLLLFFTATARADPRSVTPLDKDWQFRLGSMQAGFAAAILIKPDTGWKPVSIPHTWNNLDGQDGGDNYFRGDGWYRRTLTITPEMQGKSLFLRFEAVSRNADVYLNGNKIGTHIGGNGAFCYDITKAVHPGDNLLAVCANNAPDGDISGPLFKEGTRGGADFTYYGGIYRPVWLIATDPVHFSLTDYASSGIYITTPNVQSDKATVHVRAVVRNDSPVAQPVHVEVTLDDHAPIKHLPERLRLGDSFTLEPGTSHEFSGDLPLDHPHLWNGRGDPFLYDLQASISFDGPRTRDMYFDNAVESFGIRTFSIDPQKGFFLNAKSYPLHGVNRHQERLNEGWAISHADEDQDIALIKEMGVNALRLAHYQQSDYFYSLCDKAGIIVWAEVPNVNYIGSSPAYTANAQNSLRELIRQSYNHPSICFWSVGNEVRKPRPTDPFMSPNDVDPALWFKQMSDLAHQEDPGRLTAVANRRDTPFRDSTDVYGLNIYYGWYESSLDNVDKYFSSLPPGWALTEYGAGASIYFHSETPQKMDHSEEYQCIFMETHWAALKKNPQIWGSFVWNMFDFAVDDRFEGDHMGVNDKGLVTEDRKVEKDAFYFFKANWSDEPTVYITSKRFTTRGLETIPIKIYSNAPRLTLTVNGRAPPLDEIQPNDIHTFLYPKVQLKPGPNIVVATAILPNGKTLTDTALWTYTPGAPTEIYQAQDDTMRAVYKIGPPRANYPKKPASPLPATTPTPR